MTNMLQSQGSMSPEQMAFMMQQQQMMMTMMMSQQMNQSGVQPPNPANMSMNSGVLSNSGNNMLSPIPMATEKASEKPFGANQSMLSRDETVPQHTGIPTEQPTLPIPSETP